MLVTNLANILDLALPNERDKVDQNCSEVIMAAFLSFLFLTIISQTTGDSRNGSQFSCINYEINSDHSSVPSSQTCPRHHPPEVKIS